jgi:hypothetical protein
MKVLFLDIDGVCNSKATFTKRGDYLVIDPYMAFLVGKIQLDTGCEVVLSSSWRHMPDGIAEVEKQIVKLYDKTGQGKTRGDEVEVWLQQHPKVTRHAILDDDDDFYPYQPLFLTKWETGLTDEIAAKVVAHLNS